MYPPNATTVPRRFCHILNADSPFRKTNPLTQICARLVILALMLFAASLSALAQRPLGVDVASFQGTPNWSQVKSAGVSFAWVKATQGNYYIDPDFVYDETNGKSAGVLMGAYHFADYNVNTGTAGAITEANYFWNQASPYINGSGAYLMPMLDVEFSLTNNTPASVTQWVNQWCTSISNNGAASSLMIRPVIYTFTSFASSDLQSSVIQWPLWMASPNGQNPQTGNPSYVTPWPTWTGWQYGQGPISGISGAVDEDVFDGTLSTLTNTLVLGFAQPPGPSGTTNYWDPGLSNASPGSGGSGTWDNSTANWWLSGTGDTTWSTGGDYAVFAGTAGTVTVGATVAADGLTFSTPGYTLSGSGTVNLIGTTPTISVAPSATPTVLSCVLTGSGYTLTGGGILFLQNAANASGSGSSAETVVGPNTTLVVSTDHDVGNGGVTLNLKSGGIYQDNDTTGGDQFLLPASAIALLTGGGIFDNPNANLTMSNFITGAGSLTTIGTTFTLTLTDTGNNYSGGTIVQSGTLKANAAGVLGSTSGALTVNGGTLDLGAASHTVGAVTISSGTLKNGTLTGTSYAGQGGTVSATLAGTHALTKTTTNSLTLSGPNTYTGTTTISAGLLTISADNNLGTAPASPVANQLTINSGLSGNFGLRTSSSFALSTNRGITLGASGGAIQAASATTLTYNGVITGSGTFQAGTSPTVGEGVIILGGASTYTGPTLIACGTVRLGISGALPTGTPLTVASAAVGGTFDMNGHSQTIGPLTSSTGINGLGTVTPGVVLTGPLTILETNSSVFAGTISGAGGSVMLNGNGTLTLSGTNTYTGPTTISAGTLALGSTGLLNGTSAINIAAGTTFDVSAIPSYTISGATALSASGAASPAVINGASGGTVSLGSQPITLTYDGADPALTISQGTLSLNNNNFTVNGSPLAPGTYTIIQQTSGSITASGTFGLTGTAIGAGTTGSISVVGGNVNVIIKASPIFSNLAASPSILYGTPGITLTGKVASAGPMYPANGETITVTINGNPQTTTINDSTGDFSITYNSSGIPASTNSYNIAYAYAGDATLNSCGNAATLLTVNPLPVILTGTRPFDGTTTADASILSVTNAVGSDVVTVASGSATLTSSNVGPETISSVGTLALGGAAVGNYTLAGATGSVNITASSILITSEYLDSTGTNFIFTWQSTPGTTYHVIGASDAATALSAWTNVAGPITATDTNTSYTNPITQSIGLFKVKSP